MTAGAANRKFSRKKLEWEVPFNTSCAQFCVQPGAFCPNGGNIQLMTNVHLRDKHENACAIVAIKGHLYFQPGNSNDTTVVQTVFDQAAQSQYMRIGLRKDQVSEALAGVPIAYNPLLSGSLPDDEGDFTEGRWLWLKEHYWQPNISTSATLPLGGGKKVWQPRFRNCVNDAQDQCITPVALATGSGYTWLPTPAGVLGMRLSGEWACPPNCDDPTSFNTTGVDATAYGMQPWRLPVNIRRRITLKENDSLSLWFGWENLMQCGGDTRKTQTAMNLWGGIRLLIEK